MEQQNNQAVLFAKLARVMGRMERIPKTGKNAHFGYMFATDADVSDAVRKELAQEGVAFFASMVSVQQEGKKTLVEFEFTFACNESGTTMTNRWFGEADDSQDKGISKAATAALKYFLLKTFIFSTGDKEDDPDSAAPIDAKAKKGNAQPKRIIGRDELPAPQPEAPVTRAGRSVADEPMNDDAPFNAKTLQDLIDYTIGHSPDIDADGAGARFAGGGRLYKALTGSDSGKADWKPLFGTMTYGEARRKVDARIAMKNAQPALLGDAPEYDVVGGSCKECGDTTIRRDFVGDWFCEDCAIEAAEQAHSGTA